MRVMAEGIEAADAERARGVDHREARFSRDATSPGVFREDVAGLRAVRRLVFGEADVPVDAREIRARPSTGLEIHVERKHALGKLLQQPPERRHDVLLITLAVRVHPLLAVVARQLAEKTEGLSREDRFIRGHAFLAVCQTSPITRFPSRVNSTMLFAALARLVSRVPCLRILPFEESLMNPKPILAVSLLAAIAVCLAPLRADEQKPAPKEPWKPEDII